MLSKLDGKDLVEIYIMAVNMNLEKDFISILEYEMKRRGINYKVSTKKDN